MTVADVKKLAMENYEKGGDVIIECYDDSQIQDMLNAKWGKEDFLKMFKENVDDWNEHQYEPMAGDTYNSGYEYYEEEKSSYEDRNYARLTDDDYEEEYIPSATNGDYSPSNPWDEHKRFLLER